MSWESISTERPKAKREYPCIWCREKIQPGELHVRTAGRFDGDFQCSRFHDECYEASQQYFRETLAEGFDAHSFQRGTMEEA